MILQYSLRAFLIVGITAASTLPVSAAILTFESFSGSLSRDDRSHTVATVRQQHPDAEVEVVSEYISMGY